MKKIPFKSLIREHIGREFIVCCPGKNISEYMGQIKRLIVERKLVVIGINKIFDLFELDYHLFTNNAKYESYGGTTQGTLMLGDGVDSKMTKKHAPSQYVCIEYQDDPKNKIKYDSKTGQIYGHFRTAGNLSIMLSHLMGATKVYVAGMCGFTYKFDGDVHYYKAEMKKDKNSKKTWKNKYDKPVQEGLNRLKKYGINFSIITPTIYSKHYDSSVLDEV